MAARFAFFATAKICRLLSCMGTTRSVSHAEMSLIIPWMSDDLYRSRQSVTWMNAIEVLTSLRSWCSLFKQSEIDSTSNRRRRSVIGRAGLSTRSCSFWMFAFCDTMRDIDATFNFVAFLKRPRNLCIAITVDGFHCTSKAPTFTLQSSFRRSPGVTSRISNQSGSPPTKSKSHCLSKVGEIRYPHPVLGSSIMA